MMESVKARLEPLEAALVRGPPPGESTRGGVPDLLALVGGEKAPATAAAAPVGLPTIPLDYVAPPALLAQAKGGNPPVPALPDAYVAAGDFRPGRFDDTDPARVRFAVLESLKYAEPGSRPPPGLAFETPSDQFPKRWDGKALDRLDVVGAPGVRDGKPILVENPDTRSATIRPAAEAVNAVKQAGVLKEDSIIVFDPGRSRGLSEVPDDLKQALLATAKETGVRIGVLVGSQQNGIGGQIFVANPNGTTQLQPNSKAGFPPGL